MPFWGDSSKNENYKAKLEHKLCLAKETPEPTFDLADCNLTEVPSGVYSMCRVFLKEILLLQNNQLQSLAGGGSLKDLSHLVILNLANNKISSLPETIGYLSHLQTLNLENNRLKQLPSSFENLTNLRHLNIKGNKMTVFPSVLCKMISLESLNICDNKKIKALPKELCNLVHLKILELDSSNFTYPSEHICESGTECIMKFLCDETGKEYKSVEESLERKPSISSDEVDDSILESHWAYSELSASFLQYQRAKEQKRQELAIMEEALKENDLMQSEIAAGASERRQKLLKDVVQEQQRMEEEIMQLQNKKDKEKQNLLAILSNIEDHSAYLIKQLICLNERNKKLEEMLDVLEQDRLENEEIFTIKQEELAELRKKEILEAMKEMLQAEEKQRKYEIQRLNAVEKIQNEENDNNAKLLSIFHEKEQDQQNLINKILDEEYYQKEAFEVLQLQKDSKHKEIIRQIKLIEKELSNLTLAEIKKKDLKLTAEINMLAEHRTALAYLLTDLLSAKEKREDELKERLIEMENRRLDEIEDFWLIQYQKLLDRKPQGIIHAELTMDPLVKAVIIDAGATDFLPLFATNKITWNQLLIFDIKDLKKLGIIDEEICSAILEKTREHSTQLKYKIDDNTLEISKEEIPSPTNIPEPSAPIEEIEPSAPLLTPESEMKIWCQSECVVCMENQSIAVFLPCGHVCCCQSCSSIVEMCPMCRTEISSKFVLYFSS